MRKKAILVIFRVLSLFLVIGYSFSFAQEAKTPPAQKTDKKEEEKFSKAAIKGELEGWYKIIKEDEEKEENKHIGWGSEKITQLAPTPQSPKQSGYLYSDVYEISKDDEMMNSVKAAFDKNFAITSFEGLLAAK
ncbi:hypothetical protein HY605_02345, partial [Candidatus Peregrinibacteria bacterium]|nr:hypothetical protein [Candidatus Peregrinibacteria bacterium]